MGGGSKHWAPVSVGRECRHSTLQCDTCLRVNGGCDDQLQLLWSLQLILAVVFLGERRLSFAFDK
jgi:hypothetical protein